MKKQTLPDSKSKRTRKIWLIVSLSVILTVVLLFSVCLVFLLDCYQANKDAIEAFSTPQEISYTTDDAYTVFEPEGATVGFIFYPGAKVEHEAYLPLMEACASEGILCVLVEMPLYFPLINPNAADGIQEAYPEIRHWYIGGHSLGGYSATNYLSKHPDKFDGLILLASYSAVDLTDSELDALTIYGTEDQIMNRERYEEGLSLLPEGYTELVIDGGCHAYFGMYDGQDGSHAKGISNEEQIRLTAITIRKFVTG